MPKKISISGLILGGILIGFLLTRRAADDGVAAAATSSTTSPTPVQSPAHLPASSSSSIAAPLPPSTPVTLQDISALSYPAESSELYQRLTTELIQELFRLQSDHDRDRITSRLTPVAQKFYYLKKAHQSFDDAPPIQLPQSFSQDIRELEVLWDSNHILAQAADSVFAHLDLLDGEHVPYQLREQVLTQ